MKGRKRTVVEEDFYYAIVIDVICRDPPIATKLGKPCIENGMYYLKLRI